MSVLLDASAFGGVINYDIPIMAAFMFGALVLVSVALYLFLRRRESLAITLVSVVASVCLRGSACAYITSTAFIIYLRVA